MAYPSPHELRGRRLGRVAALLAALAALTLAAAATLALGAVTWA